ncbi:MAG: sensor histidine kinase, partial [Clostridia bacterium]|nr:sensor histidine kinase [Clostridia bacterium]
KDIDDIKVNIYTGIDSIDAVINRKEKQANAQGILTTISASYNSDICIRNIDVCVILANLFDNAIEACEKVDEVQQRFINFNISSVGTMVVIKIENSYNYELSIKLNDGVLATTKTAIDTHGYGLKIVNSIVEKYDGVLETTYDDNKFSVYVLINDK